MKRAMPDNVALQSRQAHFGQLCADLSSARSRHFPRRTGFNRKLVPGDFFLVFPDIPHWLTHARHVLRQLFVARCRNQIESGLTSSLIGLRMVISPTVVCFWKLISVSERLEKS